MDIDTLKAVRAFVREQDDRVTATVNDPAQAHQRNVNIAQLGEIERIGAWIDEQIAAAEGDA